MTEERPQAWFIDGMAWYVSQKWMVAALQPDLSVVSGEHMVNRLYEQRELVQGYNISICMGSGKCLGQMTRGPEGERL